MITKKYIKSRQAYKVTFSLPVQAADGAEEVRVLGDFNDWSWDKGTPMEANEQEYQASLELTAGQTYQFRYLVDGRTWENDWEADEYIPSPFDGIYNSVIHLEAAEAKAPAAKKAPAKKAPAKKAPAAKKAPVKKATAKKAPAVKKAAKSKAADDLKKIEGIGPKIAEIFANAGIKTFADLAKAKAAKLKTILEGAGSRYKMHDPTTWPQQAKLADKGEWEKLAKLQDELKGGKK